MTAILSPPLFHGFVLDQRYHLTRDIRPGAGKEFGSFSAGINPKGSFPDTKAVVVLAEVGGGPYADHWEGLDLIYSGEDDAPKWKKEAHLHDQSLNKGKNRVLTHQRRLNIPTYLFWRVKGDDAYRYAGLVEVVDASLAPVQIEGGGQRLEAKYRLRPLVLAELPQLAVVEQEFSAAFHATSLPPPVLTEPPRPSKAIYRVARDRVFAEKVKEAYGRACAVCSEARVNALGHAEVEAAHIFPRDLHGADDPRNGIALCRFHHWAFDGHLFVMEDDLTIRARHGGRTMRGVQEYDGHRLRILPQNHALWPHTVYLEARRKMADSIVAA